eukprot:10870208-Karenia_brevis.AAC.1
MMTMSWPCPVQYACLRQAQMRKYFNYWFVLNYIKENYTLLKMIRRFGSTRLESFIQNASIQEQATHL